MREKKIIIALTREEIRVNAIALSIYGACINFRKDAVLKRRIKSMIKRFQKAETTL